LELDRLYAGYYEIGGGKRLNKIVNKLVNEVLEEEKVKWAKRQEIIKNGCLHINKIKRIATMSRTEFLECDVCYKQFDLLGYAILEEE